MAQVWDMLTKFVLSFAQAWEWLNTTIQIGSLSISPLGLFSFTGLTALIGIMITFWVIK